MEDDISLLEWCIRLTYTGQTVDMIRYQMLKRQNELQQSERRLEREEKEKIDAILSLESDLI